jgi:hypothetical protein
MRRIVVIIFTLSVANSYGQTFDWWAQLVHWDGVSEWPKYMITQPAYMGPNALPVPRIGNGSIDSNFSISATGSLHFSKGDNTQNLTIYANYCLVKNVISFDASWIPYEHFTMSHAIKEQRHVFSHFYYDQHATGDIELNTTIQLLNRWRKNIQLALRIGYRFPTGTGLGVARYTDGPGYHFDLSFGKSINTSLKWIGMLGFYSWQLINVGRRQDDAFLFGTGAEWNTKTVRLQTYISGYLGYQLNSGDKPVVFRATVEKKIKRTSLLLGFQQGLHDFKYSSIEVGAKYRLQ